MCVYAYWASHYYNLRNSQYASISFVFFPTPNAWNLHNHLLHCCPVQPLEYMEWFILTSAINSTRPSQVNKRYNDHQQAFQCNNLYIKDITGGQSLQVSTWVHMLHCEVRYCTAECKLISGKLRKYVFVIHVTNTTWNISWCGHSWSFLTFFFFLSPSSILARK